MRLSNEDALKEFEGEQVQGVLKTVAETLGTEFTSVKLKDWGGQGLVIRLECPLYDFQICAKIPHYDAPGLAEALHANLKEAQINEALTKLGADYVPRLLCYGQDGSYLVREFVEGTLLDDELKKASPEERIRLAYLEWETVSKGFTAIHENGIQPYVIRDLKAKNMILSANRDKISLIDLGSCRREDNMVSKRKMRMWSRFGSGKFLHWPLEQLTEDADKCSRKVDYFAFGVLVYETLFGYRPYTNTVKIIPLAAKRYAEEYEVAKATIQKAVEAKQIPEDLADIMVKTLNPDPDNREFVKR